VNRDEAIDIAKAIHAKIAQVELLRISLVKTLSRGKGYEVFTECNIGGSTMETIVGESFVVHHYEEEVKNGRDSEGTTVKAR
jgi:hypothetical protein